MMIRWVLFAIFAEAVEAGAIFYLLSNKFPSKYRNFFPALLFFAGIAGYISLSMFNFNIKGLPSAGFVTFIGYLTFVLLCREGEFEKKIFWIAFIYILLYMIPFLINIIFTFITSIFSWYIPEQYGPGFIAYPTVKLFTVIIFYILSFDSFDSFNNKNKNNKNNKSGIFSFIICCGAPAISYYIFEMTSRLLRIKEDGRYVAGTLELIIMTSYLLINVVVFAMYVRINKETEKQNMLIARQTQYELTEKHNSQIVGIYSNMREWRHDCKNHMQIILGLLEKSDVENSSKSEAVNYIKNIDEKIKSASLIISTGNHIVDAIISAKTALASSNHIDFKHNIFLPGPVVVSNTELCSILSNLLDNAIEACCKIQENRYIAFDMMIVKNQLNIKVCNSTDGKYKIENGGFKTTKQGDLHGIGINHIKSIVENYNGLYDIKAEKNSFTAQISIPLIVKTNKK